MKQTTWNGDAAARQVGLRWIGGCVMAQVIEFYIPSRFKAKVKWIPQEQRGKIIAFPIDFKKSA